MPTISITKRAVDAAAPEIGPDGKPRRTLYFDKALRGFGLVVTPDGSKSFIVQYRAGHGRKAPTRRMTLGSLGTLTPDEARAEAKQHLADVTRGKDPAAERAERRKGGADSGKLTAVVAEWLKRDQAGNRSRGEVERIMNREVLPKLGTKQIAEIRKADLIKLVEEILDRGSPVMANRVLAHTKRLFRWAAGRDLIEVDPAAHIEKPSPERSRDRVLDDDELVEIWQAATTTAGPFGAGLRMLIATGARREEMFGLERTELMREPAGIVLPAGRSKVKEQRLIPLSPMAVIVLDDLEAAMPVISVRSPCAGAVERITCAVGDCVMPGASLAMVRRRGSAAASLAIEAPDMGTASGSRVTAVHGMVGGEVAAGDALVALHPLGRFMVSATGDKPFGNIGHGKAKLDALLARRRAEVRLGRELSADEKPEPGDELPPWRLHDLRRTVATGLQRLGVRLEVIEAVLGHVSGSRAGIIGVYQRHRFDAEAREALAVWSAHLQRLINGDTASGKVVPLRRA